jgi:hypothetical protein
LQDGFLRGTEEHAHGSLIVLREALKYTGDDDGCDVDDGCGD